jgi:paraquat-inducible protein B
MKLRLLKTIFAAGCFGAISACNPTQPTPPIKTTETAAVEEKIRKFKAEPSKVNMQEVEKALADLNAEIKELELRQSTVGGAEKDEATRKLSDLRAKYNAYNTDFTAARVQASANKAGEATGEALKKAGEAVKDAAQSVGDSFKSDKTGN